MIETIKEVLKTVLYNLKHYCNEYLPICFSKYGFFSTIRYIVWEDIKECIKLLFYLMR